MRRERDAAAPVPNRPTVLVAEDDFLIREGYLCPMLSSDFDIIAAVGSGFEALTAAEQHHPRLVLLDVSLPGLRGFEVARRILANQPQCTVVFVSNYAESAYVEAARSVGARGYVMKSRVTTDLLAAVRSALGGHFYSSASIL